MKNILIIAAIVAVLYFLSRKTKPAPVTLPAPRIPKYVATGINGTMDIVSVAASQPIIPTSDFLNYSENAD